MTFVTRRKPIDALGVSARKLKPSLSWPHLVALGVGALGKCDPAHHRARQNAVEEGDQEQLPLDSELVADDPRRIVVRCGVVEDTPPEGDHSLGERLGL